MISQALVDQRLTIDHISEHLIVWIIIRNDLWVFHNSVFIDFADDSRKRIWSGCFAELVLEEIDSPNQIGDRTQSDDHMCQRNGLVENNMMISSCQILPVSLKKCLC